MSTRVKIIGAVAGTAMLLAAVAPAVAAAPARPRARHVLVLSVDGLHQSDLAYYVARHPGSALARLVHGGADYTNARTTFPSDSFPGMVAQFTGARPGTSGLYYDDTYNHALLPPGTRDCATAARGTEVSWTEAADLSQDPITLDAGQGLADPALGALATNTPAQTLADAPAVTKAILDLTPTPQALLDPRTLPVDPSTCTPLYPHDYLRVNTVFDVARAHGLTTAWSDKHPAYEILNGPSGSGIQDLFTPEINSVADASGDDWTTDNALTAEYDGFKVAAVVNEIRGFDHSGRRRVGTPAIFGMNFQTVSTAQKLPTSDGLTGGYDADGTPGPLLNRALDYVNAQVARLQKAIRRAGIAGSTDIILSAKHGQSPIDPTALRRVDDGAIIDALDAGWAAGHPGAAPLVTFSVDDDVMLLWLSDRSPAALAYARHYLLSHAAPANRSTDAKGVYSTTVASSGLTRVVVGAGADALFGARRGDAHAPDLVGITRHGVVYTGGVKKIAEHGGDSADDRNVPLVVSGAGITHAVATRPVQTTQIAPTILALLGLDPQALSGVRRDHTATLAGLRR
jgi:hypothetical protein